MRKVVAYLSILKGFFHYLKNNKKYYLIPIYLVLILFGLLALLLGGIEKITPFLYPLI